MTPTPHNKPCWKCGTPTSNATCGPCTTPPPTRKQQARRNNFVQQWITTYGPVCPGHNRPLHTVPPNQLEADHITPRTQAGENSPLQALCKSCNSSKQDGWR